MLRLADEDANADDVDLVAQAVVDPGGKAYESLTTSRPCIRESLAGRQAAVNNVRYTNRPRRTWL